MVDEANIETHGFQVRFVQAVEIEIDRERECERERERERKRE